jgi:MFS family permease
VLLGGVIASHWGWQAAFGVVGAPGLVLALMYLLVRDYRTVTLEPKLEERRQSVSQAAMHIVRVLGRSRTMLWVCVGGAAQLILVSALWSWLPSFLNRVHGVDPAKAGAKAALVVLCGALGAVVWGAVIDRAGSRAPHRKLAAMATLSLVSMVVLVAAFAWAPLQLQFPIIALGGFFATCTVGPVSAIVIDVIHPGLRATGSSVLALFQNLFGLAAGPFIAGVLSDAFGIVPALAATPLFALVAAAAFLRAGSSYESDRARAAEPSSVAPVPPRPATA